MSATHVLTSVAVTLLSAAPSGCSDSPRLILELTPGGEGDAFVRAPAPPSMDVETLPPPAAAGADAGAPRTLAQVPMPQTEIDLGPVDQGTVYTLRLLGRDPNAIPSSAPILFGQTLPIEVDAPSVGRVRVFVQRTGELARMPGALSITSPAPLVDRLGARYLVVAAGTRAELFDLATFATRGFDLPRTPDTIVAAKDGLLVLDKVGAALVDTSGQSRVIAAPAGGRLDEVVGGAVIRREDGVAFVIGGTVPGRVSSTILRVGADGALTFLRGVQARSGAAATYVEGRGVVVMGGSSEGAGVELVSDAGSVALPFPPLASAGATARASATRLDDRRVLFASGSALGTADLTCTSACTLTTWGGVAPAPIAAMMRLGDGSVLGLSDDGVGAFTRAFRLREAGDADAITLRSARSGARLVEGVAGAALVVGGSREIESFVAPAL